MVQGDLYECVGIWEYCGLMLRSCPEVDWNQISNVGVDRDVGNVRVRMDFGFSFDATPMVYCPVFQNVDEGRQRWIEEDEDDLGGTSSSRKS